MVLLVGCKGVDGRVQDESKKEPSNGTPHVKGRKGDEDFGNVGADSSEPKQGIDMCQLSISWRRSLAAQDRGSPTFDRTVSVAAADRFVGAPVAAAATAAGVKQSGEYTDKHGPGFLASSSAPSNSTPTNTKYPFTHYAAQKAWQKQVPYSVPPP